MGGMTKEYRRLATVDASNAAYFKRINDKKDPIFKNGAKAYLAAAKLISKSLTITYAEGEKNIATLKEYQNYLIALKQALYQACKEWNNGAPQKNWVTIFDLWIKNVSDACVMLQTDKPY